MIVSELSGALLDYWVARAEGLRVLAVHNHGAGTIDHFITYDRPFGNVEYRPSTSWAQGGPILERGIQELFQVCKDRWCASDWDDNTSFGDTPLIAAMRAYVASKFGEHVPDEVTA